MEQLFKFPFFCRCSVRISTNQIYLSDVVGLCFGRNLSFFDLQVSSRHNVEDMKSIRNRLKKDEDFQHVSVL
jgi:hypothetical protein